MRSLMKRLRREKVSIEQSLIDKTRAGITVNELRKNEWRLNRIEFILRGVKNTMTKYATLARIESLERSGKRQKAII